MRLLTRHFTQPVKKCLFNTLLAITLTTACLFAFSQQANAGGVQPPVTLSVKNATLKKVLNQINRQTRYRFIYTKQLLEKSRPVTFNIRNVTVKQALKICFRGQPFTYHISNKRVFITVRKVDPFHKEIPMISSEPADELIADKVEVNLGEPLTASMLRVKSTGIPITTDANGKFYMDTSAINRVLFISLNRYQSKKVDTMGEVHLPLIKEPVNEDDWVVVAYGNSTKKHNTAASQSVKAIQLQDIPASQIIQQLQGKFAGVQISQATGKPGQGMAVKIRGQLSILAGSAPLYVVDGFPVSGDISSINPDEIETVSVLKDGAATSLYGARAANGVIVISTKHATPGENRISVNAYRGYQSVSQKGRPDMMNATEFAQYKKESYEDLGLAVPSQFQNPSQYGKGYNWYDAMLRVAPIENYSVSFQANKKTYSTSVVAGYFNQEGVLRNSDYRRFSLRANTEFKISDKIKAGVNIAPSYSTGNMPASDGAYDATNVNPGAPGGLLNNSLLTWPMLPYVNTDGSLPLTVGMAGVSNFPTPNWYRALGEIKSKTNYFRILSNAYIGYQPVKGLSLKSTFNIDRVDAEFNNFTPSTSSASFAAVLPGSASVVYNNSNYDSWLNENTASYKKSFRDHHFDGLLGFAIQQFRTDVNQVAFNNFPDNNIPSNQSTTNIDPAKSFQDDHERGLVSYMSRLNYNYRSRYFLTAALRYDGVSRFGTNRQWGNFPSVSAGWLVSEENFLDDGKFVSFLKIRGSYGTAGNSNIGNDASYIAINHAPYSVVGTNIAGAQSMISLANQYQGWETTKQFDLGIDLSLLNGRINFTYDFYVKNTTNLLYDLSVPLQTGAGNRGQLKFWGHEFVLTTINKTGGFKWNTDFNISFSDHKVMALPGGVDCIVAGANGYETITKVGGRMGQFWGLIHEGVYKDQLDFERSPLSLNSEVGTAKFRDVNGDGMITYGGVPGADDRTIIGNPFPEFLFGITNNFAFGNFGLTIVGSGAVGNNVAVLTDRGTTSLDGSFNVLKELKYRWRSSDNPGAGLYGKTTAGTPNEKNWLSSRFISNAGFFAIKNIALGYNLPVKKIFRSARVYASVQQAFVFTGYRGANPEVGTTLNGTPGSDLNMGMDWGTYGTTHRNGWYKLYTEIKKVAPPNTSLCSQLKMPALVNYNH